MRPSRSSATERRTAVVRGVDVTLTISDAPGRSRRPGTMAFYRGGCSAGHWSRDRETAPADFRRPAPRISGDNLERNLELVEALRLIADEKGATVAQVAIAWVLSRGEWVVALVGARTRGRLAESLGAAELELSGDELARIGTAVPPGAAAGERYDAQQMAIPDSQRD